MNKCLYCTDTQESTHFMCARCGDGMCDSCYDSEKEHDIHYNNPHEVSPELRELKWYVDYLCEDCLESIVITKEKYKG